MRISAWSSDVCAADLASVPHPARSPRENVADFKAQVAANARGVEQLHKLVAQYGLDVVQAYMRHVSDNAEESVRRVLDRLEDGAFTCETDFGAKEIGRAACRERVCQYV